MAAIGGAANFAAEYRAWEQINTGLPPITTAAAAPGVYNISRTIPYPPPAVGLPPPVPNGLTPILNRLKPNPIPPAAPAALAVVLPSRPDFPGNPAHWTGVKILGAGAFGEVSLWEWNKPAGVVAPPVPKIAVKTAATPAAGSILHEEGQVMNGLNMANSAHIVELIVNPPVDVTLASAAAEGLPVGWVTATPRVRRLIMEYCDQGSLRELIRMRRARNLRFEELTLWKIFECLIDGCAAMQHGGEFVYNALGIAQIDPTSPYVTLPPQVAGHVHFDLKPANVMTSSRDIPPRPAVAVPPAAVPPGTHPDTPICKLGDFGNAVLWPDSRVPIPIWNWSVNQKYRYRGTPAYLAPEQFSDRWNHSDYITSPDRVCGVYSAHTNVWGIGQIMYDLACYDQAPVEAHRPWTPATIHSVPSLGRVFGVELSTLPFSLGLKDTIQECLRVRQSILTLGTTANMPGGVGKEQWSELNRVEPLMPAAMLQFRTVKLLCTRTEFAGRGRCGNRVKWRRGGQGGPVRCWKHWDTRRYPFGGV
ncbi:uncharacterized protein RSE6_07265 [Rhynchosporium secalis]|uniref:Protein kinase domain-containing protein n=1 Tax=Rhynchosporium secalis TaxID=38038 RepID=A0A1E1MCG9_RHYSE|nr:uncharacterized protein RSE6_07265 [Rhynchosporium secalis]